MADQRPDTTRSSRPTDRTAAEQSLASVRRRLKRVDKHVAASRARLAQLKSRA
jgi:hypothetical protein